MRKSNYVAKTSNGEHIKLKALEGTVISSELKLTGGNWCNLELTLDTIDLPVWIRGEHRIDEGETIRIHYSEPSNAIVAEAYEILRNGLVKFRYHDKDYEFIN